MPVEIQCTECGRRLRVRDDLAGRRVKCPDCGNPIEVVQGSRRRSAASDGSRQRRRPTNRSPEPADAAYQRPRAAGRELDPFASPGSAVEPVTAAQRKPSPGKTAPFTWVAVIGGILSVLVCGGAISAFVMSTRNVAEIGTVGDPIPLGEVPLPEFPDLGAPQQALQPSGVEVFRVDLSSANRDSTEPGSRMIMRIYRPPGERAPKSAPCVLVAPAGTNLLVGNALDGDDYHDETLPYAENGIVTIFYSIDGSAGDLETASDAAMASAYRDFRAARAGLVNGRNALEFAIRKLPEVDPDRIYCAGHSSAGTLSLLLASHEKRIAGCIAYAPCSDVEHFLKDFAEEPAIRLLLPRVQEFVRQTSPKTHAQQLTCPLFVFHAEDDAVSPIRESAQFVTMVGTPPNEVDFMRTRSGGHYAPMIDEGIPAGIRHIQEWGLRERALRH